MANREEGGGGTTGKGRKGSKDIHQKTTKNTHSATHDEHPSLLLVPVLLDRVDDGLRGIVPCRECVFRVSVGVVHVKQVYRGLASDGRMLEHGRLGTEVTGVEDAAEVASKEHHGGARAVVGVDEGHLDADAAVGVKVDERRCVEGKDMLKTETPQAKVQMST